MEKHIGRELLDHENVHHKNGIRDDNDISNLELWTTHQPTGSRVIDKMAWCEKFLAEYGHTINWNAKVVGEVGFEPTRRMEQIYSLPQSTTLPLPQMNAYLAIDES